MAKRYSPYRFIVHALSGFALCAAMVAPVLAADTIDKIMSSHTITLGVRDKLPPFSSLDKAGKAQGYTADVCQKVVESIRKELKLHDLKVKEVVVTAADRLDKVKDGTIDLECGSTVITKDRLNQVDFSYTILFGAQRLLAGHKSGINSQADLGNKTVAVIKGTTGEKVLLALQARDIPTIKVKYVANNDEALAALEAGEVQAFLQMDISAEFLRMKSRNPDNFVLTSWPLTAEPLALPLRKDDARFRNLVNNALRNLYSGHEYRTIYDRWFNSGVKIPLSAMMMENLRRPGSSPGYALVMGVEL